MTTAFSKYEDAFSLAQSRANDTGHDMAIEKAKPYGKLTYLVHYVPAAKFRAGMELRWEIVHPMGVIRLGEGI